MNGPLAFSHHPFTAPVNKPEQVQA